MFSKLGRIFIIIYLFGTFLHAEPLANRHSEYNRNESALLQKVEEFLRNHKIRHFAPNRLLGKDKKLHPEIKEVLDFIHPYAEYTPKWKGSRHFFETLLIAYKNLPPETLLRVLEISYSAFPKEFSEQVEKIYQEVPHTGVTALAYLYLKQSHIPVDLIPLQQLPDALTKKLTEESHEYPVPSLIELFQHTFQGRKFAIVLRMESESRMFLKDSSDRWVDIGTGINTLSVLQIPYFLINGNTPEGIFKFRKITTSSNPRIGPTPVIQLSLPQEISPGEFFSEPEIKYYNRENLGSLFPESWRNYEPIYGSWVAGQMGRSGIWIHGSTLTPQFFSGNKNRLTKTYGCISLPEHWEKGILLRSEQENLLKIWNADYLILVNIPIVEMKKWKELEGWLKSPENRGKFDL